MYLCEIQNKYILNFTEHFSKFVKAYLIDNKKTEIVIDKFNDYIKSISRPEIIHTDNGGGFKSSVFADSCKNVT